MLTTYCDQTRQKVNLAKSGVFFSSNLDRTTQGKLKRLLYLREIQVEEKYLRNPMFFNRSKIQTFSFIREKVVEHLSSWQANYSLKRVDTLLSSVLCLLSLCIPCLSTSCLQHSCNLWILWHDAFFGWVALIKGVPILFLGMLFVN